MGDVVGGFLMPHDPLVLTAPDAPALEVRDRVRDAYAEAGRRLAALEPTTVVIFGADHYVLFGPGCLPQLLIGIGDLDGPVERLPGLARGPIPDNAVLARDLASHGHRSGIDWAVATSLTVDHSVAIPYAQVVAPLGVPVVPVYLACGVEPLIPLRRAAQVGAGLREAIRARDDEERVVVIGSGGISHWVGTADMGRVNVEFDREVLDLVRAGDVQALCAFSDDVVEERAGNGALEIRTFVAAMAAVGEVRGEVIAYEAVPEWITGLGFAELRPAPVVAR